MPARRSRRGLAADAVLAAGFAAAGLAQLVVPNDDTLGEGALWLNVTAMVLSTLPLAVRRLAPGAVAVFVFGVHAVIGLFTAHAMSFWGSVLPLAVAIYTAARWGNPARVVHLLALPVALMVTFPIHVPSFRQPDDFVFTSMLFGAAWGAGRVISRLTWQQRALDEALRLVEEQHDDRRRQVLLEERTRIAREMHDVVAHGVSVMVVQAGAARMELDETAVEARAALLEVERTGRDVLDELRRTVSLLRTGDASTPSEPSPGLAQIPALVQAMRTAGLDVRLELDPELAADPGRELATYRIVQESLTNTLRHAGPTPVTVRVGADPDLWVEVVDHGSRGGTTRRESGGGNGLVGMRERVAMYGGLLQAEQHGKGFVVRARIPLEPAR